MVGLNGSAQKRASFSRLFVRSLVLWFGLCSVLFPSIASAQGEPGFPGGGGASVAKDVETGDIDYKEITDLIRRHDRVIWEVVVETGAGETETFETTDDHPWWIPEVGWVETENLSTGMTATTADGQAITISSITQTTRTDATYNITVADFETYFVGKQRVLVHNCGNKGFTQAKPQSNTGYGNQRTVKVGDNPGAPSVPKDPMAGKKLNTELGTPDDFSGAIGHKNRVDTLNNVDDSTGAAIVAIGVDRVAKLFKKKPIE